MLNQFNIMSYPPMVVGSDTRWLSSTFSVVRFSRFPTKYRTMLAYTITTYLTSVNPSKLQKTRDKNFKPTIHNTQEIIVLCIEGTAYNMYSFEDLK